MLRTRLLTIARYDFSPQWSQAWRQRLASPLAVMLLAIGVAFLVGLTLHHRVFALAGGLLGVAVIGVCWPWITMRGVRAELEFRQSRISEGESVEVVVTLSNHAPWPSWGLSVVAMGVTTTLPRVAGRARTQFHWPFIPDVRGEYPLSSVTIGTRFPFGLWESSQILRVAQTLIVWPRTFDVCPVPTTGGSQDSNGSVARNRVGTTGDLLGVRPYRRGDSTRRIHWVQSARHDRLIVCEVQANSRPIILLVLDGDPAIHSPGTNGSREWAIRVTASLAKGWLNAGAQVGLAVGSTLLSPSSGTKQLHHMLDALARLPSDCVPLDRILSMPYVHAHDDSTCVVISTDRQRSIIPHDESRWIVLETRGFSSVADEDCSAPTRRAWMRIPSVEQLPHQLRHGTSEASHGS